MRNGVDLNQFSKVPFVLSFKSGKVNHAIQEYLIYNNVQLNVPYNISDIKTQIQLCATGLCASLCPKMLLQNAYIHNSSCQNKQSYLHAFPIKHLGRDLHIDLVSHKNVIHPDFIRRFVGILKEEVAEIARRELLEENF
jgi:DNA-binding transcriptional LysR family regulator